MKKLSIGGPVIRIRLNKQEKKVDYVQSFVKDGKDTYSCYICCPARDEDGILFAEREDTYYLTKAEMLELSGSGLWPNTDGYVWYQAPKLTPVGVSAELQAVKFWLRRHPEYTV